MKQRKSTAHNLGTIFAFVFWGCLLILCLAFKDEITVERIANLVPANPVLAILVILILFAVKGISVFIYCGVLYAVCGILFPLPVAVLINVLGSAAMVSLPFWIGRKAGTGMLERLIEKHPKLKQLQELPNQSELIMAFFTRVIGVLPSDPVSMYFGACGMRYGRFLVGSLIGLLPIAVSFAVMGENIQSVTSPVFAVSVGVVIGSMILAIILYRVWRKRHKIDTKKSDAVKHDFID